MSALYTQRATNLDDHQSIPNPCVFDKKQHKNKYFLSRLKWVAPTRSQNKCKELNVKNIKNSKKKKKKKMHSWND